MYMVQHVTGGVVALAGAGHCHTVGGVWAAVLGWVQLPAELTCDGEREVGLLLSWLPLQTQSTAGHHYIDIKIMIPDTKIKHSSSCLKPLILSPRTTICCGDFCQEMFRWPPVFTTWHSAMFNFPFYKQVKHGKLLNISPLFDAA